jgi:uncharacterized protein (DUF1499 family)
MAIGFPAKFELTVKSELDKDTFIEKSKETIELIGWKIKVFSDDYIQAKSTFNLYTFGETIEIYFEDLNHIRLKSACNFQIFDANKNKINIRTFWSYFAN